jgi:hypothetical protein
MFDLELPERFRRYVPLAVWLIVALVVVMIPLKIISYGYLPGDDALRHGAHAVTDKSWPEVLVLNPEVYRGEHELGWHQILVLVHWITGWDAEGLVLFSVAALFLLVNGAVLPWLKRPEAWLAALLPAMIISDLPQRFLLGRPFVVTIAVLMMLLLATQKARPGLKYFFLFSGLFISCTYIHGVWYLWLLPLAAFVFAGELAWAGLVAGAWLTGTAGAALLTGHPVDYLANALLVVFHGVGQHSTNLTQAVELKPFGGDILAVILVGALVGLRLLTKLPGPAFARSPAFWLMCGCWILSFRVGRFWEDWGWPALMVLIATDAGALLSARTAPDSLRRLLLALILGVATFLAVTSDLNNRYTKNLTTQFLSEQAHPELAGWMPESGGILYAPDMGVFYQTFFKNPAADWRYMVGYEPALMPPEDFETYCNIIWNGGDARAYSPWVEKMKPADRLVIHGGKGQRPNIPELEWYYGVTDLWIGRTPRSGTAFPLKSLR